MTYSTNSWLVANIMILDSDFHRNGNKVGGGAIEAITAPRLLQEEG
jgi:hypothetical protein